MTKSQNAINWLEALLSGEYKQGKNILGNEQTGFCCWGLACHITKVKYNPSSMWHHGVAGLIGINKKRYEEEGDIYQGRLLTPIKYKNEENLKLAVANDEGAPFDVIAKHLIKHAKEQFHPTVAKNIQSHFKHLL